MLYALCEYLQVQASLYSVMYHHYEYRTCKKFRTKINHWWFTWYYFYVNEGLLIDDTRGEKVMVSFNVNVMSQKLMV